MQSAKSKRGQRNNQCGATFVETAIVFVVFLGLAMGLIDWGVIYTKRMLIRNAFYQAARAGAMLDEACTDAANAEYQRQIGKFGDFLPQIQINGLTKHVGTGDAEIAGLELSTTVSISCVTCPLFPGASSKTTTYSLRSFYPYQSQTSICAGAGTGVEP